MTQHARRGRKMASFMAGASVLALSVAGAGSAVAAPLLFGPGGSGGTVTVTAPTTYDFIVIDSYTVNGDVDNFGHVGHLFTTTAITVQNGATITGTLHNEVGGIIQASSTGILVAD